MVNKHLWKMSTIQNREDNDTKKPTKHLLFISFLFQVKLVKTSQDLLIRKYLINLISFLFVLGSKGM